MCLHQQGSVNSNHAEKCMVETPFECTARFAGLCSQGKIIVKVQQELEHAVLFQLLKVGVICCR